MAAKINWHRHGTIITPMSPYVQPDQQAWGLFSLWIVGCRSWKGLRVMDQEGPWQVHCSPSPVHTTWCSGSHKQQQQHQSIAHLNEVSHTTHSAKKVKVAHTRLPSVGFRSWSQFLAVSLQVVWVINPAVGCHYFLPGLQLPPQPLRGLLPVLLLGEQRHDGCEQFA